MRARRSLRWLLSLAALVAAAGPAFAEPESPLRPDPARHTFIAKRARGGLSPADRATLDAGDTVARPMVFERGGGRYVGGVAYQMVRATPEEVLSALVKASELPRLLPRTKSARLVGTAKGG